MEYIWHCPKGHCGAILNKTKEHFLDIRGSQKCKRCNTKFSNVEVMRFNKHNIRKYVLYLDSLAVDNLKIKVNDTLTKK